MKSISAIIPNYNGRDLLEKNLPTLIDELQCTGVDFEIIVADDKSTDDSIAFLEENYPNIILIKKECNSGFSATCNAGINVASKELIFLMNSDIILTKNYFEPQFKFFEREDTFGVMGKIIGYFDDKIQDTAKYPKMNGTKLKATINYLIDDYQPNFWTPSFYLSGANALVDAKKLKAIGGFDELFSPFYYEDMDLSIRAQRLGWKCYYEHQAVCRHEGSVSTNKIRKTWVDTIYRRNRFVIHAVHFSGLRLLAYNIQIVFELLFRWINGRFGVYKGYIKYLSMQKSIQDSRKRLRSQVAVGKQLLSLEQVIENMHHQLYEKKVKKL